MGPDKAWGGQLDLGARYRPSYPLGNSPSEALAVHTGVAKSHRTVNQKKNLLSSGFWPPLYNAGREEDRTFVSRF